MWSSHQVYASTWRPLISPVLVRSCISSICCRYRSRNTSGVAVAGLEPNADAGLEPNAVTCAGGKAVVELPPLSAAFVVL